MRARRRGLGISGESLLAPLVGGALAIDLLMISGLLLLIARQGLIAFWPLPLTELELAGGEHVVGEVHEVEAPGTDGPSGRLRIKVGNRDIEGIDFRWIDQDQIAGRRQPRDAVLLERREWGNFYGYARELRSPNGGSVRGAALWPALQILQRQKRAELAEIEHLERGPLWEVNNQLERLRLEGRAAERRGEPTAIREQVAARVTEARARYRKLASNLARRRKTWDRGTLVVETANGQRRELPVAQIVRALRPNRLRWIGRLSVWGERVFEFVSDDPRESNTEGGIFPALFGTVMMVLLMSLAVAPFGVIAAVYMGEYARQGWLVRMVRISVNNLASVPSIVFGIFGLGFFVYGVGGTIDRLFFADALPTPTFGTGGILWASLTLALLTLPVVIVATEEGLSAVPRATRDGSRALGATQFETLRRIVLPAAAPGILTGLVLAIARAAGEVAPLMLLGVVKLAPSLPLDGHFPYLHIERKFMHLGFHIYDVGFQSPNVEAAEPLVFATSLLLISIVLGLTLVAIIARDRLRRRYASDGLS